MSSGHKAMTLFVTVLLGLILVILGLCADWPLWAWPTAVALLLVIARGTHRVLTPKREAFPREFGPDPDLQFPEPHRQEQRIAHVALPSSVPDYDFSFSATVRWLVVDATHDAPYINPAGLAVEAVLQRARALTAHQSPNRSAFVQYQLDGVLGTMHPDSSGRVMAMAQDVSLGLPELDRERLVKLSNVRKDEDVWEHERNYERSKRAYLGDDVLKDPGTAVVWWLSRNEQEVEGAVDRIGLLARLSAAANNENVAPVFEHLVSPPVAPYAEANGGRHASTGWQWTPGSDTPASSNGAAPDSSSGSLDSLDSFLAWFGFAPGDPDLVLFAERLTNLARAHDKSNVVDELRRRFGPAQPATVDDEDDAATPTPEEPPTAPAS
ncbi:hypothetical protein [Streptomyces sp. NPDC047070]|uniref:hypothetical protein n=1 Tax=Streptomyces sp. NPDC047070 TaxID=3154923 RepID=UPI003454B73D